MKENSREEDINRCNKLTETTNANWIGISNQLAIKHILSDYKRVLKENEELKVYNNSITSQLEQMTTEKFKEGWIHQSEFKDFIPVQKVKDKIEELQKEYNKLDKQVDKYINDANKNLSKYYENKEKIGTMQTLAWVIDNLQELLEGGQS